MQIYIHVAFTFCKQPKVTTTNYDIQINLQYIYINVYLYMHIYKCMYVFVYVCDKIKKNCNNFKDDSDMSESSAA